MHISVFSKQKLESILSACPFCGSGDIVKHGTCAGHQRYLCKRCRHSFVSRYGSMAYRSKLKPCKIKSRAKAFIDKLSLRSIADLFHVNKNTALIWRKKFLLAACGRLADTKLSGRVEIDGKYVNVSISWYRKTGTGRKFIGLSVNKVALAIGCDSHNRHVFSGLERASFGKQADAFPGRQNREGVHYISVPKNRTEEEIPAKFRENRRELKTGH